MGMGRASRAKRERREERAGRDRPARMSVGMTRGCLVCRSQEGPFTSREHPFPESLGNTEIVLPPGVVCDRCNHGPLSTLDQTICEFMPVQMRRTMLGVKSKAGSVPRTRLTTGVVESTGPAALRFLPNGGKAMLRETFRDGDTVGLRFDLKGGRRVTPRYASELSRWLLKTALELAWLDHGEMMLEARFDHIRDAVLGRPYDGFFAMGNKGDPEQGSVSLTYDLVPDSDEWRMWVVAEVFGVTLATDSRLHEPPVPLEGRASVLQFTRCDWTAAYGTTR